MTTLLITLLAVLAQPAQELEGIVRDSNGDPVAGATVILVHASDAAEDVTATTDADGRFRLVPADSQSDGVQLLAWKKGFAVGAVRQEHGLRSYTFNVGEESGGELDIVLAAGAASEIQLKASDGVPVRDATVTPMYLGQDGQYVYRDKGLPTQFAATSDEHGRVRLPGVTNGMRGGFYVDTTAHGRQHFSLADDGTVPRTVVLAPVGELHGRLVAGPTDRLEGWTVSLTPSSTVTRGSEPVADPTSVTAIGRGTAVTSADGSFEVSRLAAGAYRITAQRDGAKDFFADGTQTVTITPGETAEVAVEMKRAQRAFGRVTERGSDKPIAGVVLQFGGAAATSDEKGAFEGFVINAPTYVSITSAPDGYINPPYAGRSVQLKSDPVEAIDLGTITLKKTQFLSGVVRNEAGDAVGGVVVTASWTQEDDGGGWTFSSGSETAVSDAKGAYRLVRTADDVTLLLTAFGKGLATEAALRVSAGDSREVNLTVSERFTTKLLARVMDANGNSIPSAAAKFEKQLETADGQSFGGRRIMFARKDSLAADATGTIRTPIPLEQSGKYSLEISADGFLPLKTQFIQPAGGGPESLLGEFTLERARSASGLVLDTAGKPVPGVNVSGHGVPTMRHGDQPVVRVQSDAMGSFSLSPLHPATALVTVRAEGYRPTGAVIPDSGEGMRITIYRNEETIAEQDRVEVPSLNEAHGPVAIALLEKILPHVRSSNYFHSEALKLLSRVAPDKLVGELAHTTNATAIVEALVLLGEFEEANAQAEQIENGYSRGYARFKIIDACPDEQLKRQLIATALIDAKTIQEPDRRAVVLAGVAQRLAESGQDDQARALLTESLPQFQQLPDNEWAGFAKGMFAERLARYDFDAALAMLEGMEPHDKARHAGNIAHYLADIEPEKAEQIVAISDASNLVIAYRIRACYRMAAVDLDRAERIRQGTKQSSSYAKEHTLGVMAMAIHEQQPDKSRELLRQAWSELEATVGQPNGNTQAGVYRFGVSLALLSYAESIDPDNLTDYFWRAIALYPGPQGYSWQPDQQQIEDLQRQSVLVLAFGLYQREPAMCRRIMEPAFAYWSNPQHLQDHSFYRKTATFSAMALADPARAGQWAIDARDMMPETNRTSIPQPWQTVLTTLCSDRQAIHDMLGDEVFTRWNIDKYD